MRTSGWPIAGGDFLSDAPFQNFEILRVTRVPLYACSHSPIFPKIMCEAVVLKAYTWHEYMAAVETQ